MIVVLAGRRLRSVLLEAVEQVGGRMIVDTIAVATSQFAVVHLVVVQLVILIGRLVERVTIRLAVVEQFTVRRLIRRTRRLTGTAGQIAQAATQVQR